MSDEKANRCLACERGSDVTPLIALEYRGERLWICPQHLPVLIHDPGQLVAGLPEPSTCVRRSITTDGRRQMSSNHRLRLVSMMGTACSELPARRRFVTPHG